METFWDTSAILPLVYQEVHTPLATAAVRRAGLSIAWEWLQVEARLAVARRGDDPDRLARLREWFDSAEWQSFGNGELNQVISLGVRHKLRAADAGHLHSLLQIRRLFPKIVFVCFDDDLTQAAKAEGVSVWDG